MSMFPFAVEGKKNLLQIPDLPPFENEKVGEFAVLYSRLCNEYIEAINKNDEKTKGLLFPFFSKLVKEIYIKEDISPNDKVKLESWFDEILKRE